MSEEKNKKKICKTSVRKYLILIGALILVLIYVVIPRVMDLRRRINIAKDLESVYTGIDIVEVTCDKKPTYKSDLEERGEFFGDAFPEEGLYYFYVYGSEDDYPWMQGYGTMDTKTFLFAQGYAAKDGTVIYDTYAGLYYADESASYFESVVDFEHNFPELDYYIKQGNSNISRFVQTHECTTFEGYRNAKVGRNMITTVFTYGYPELRVGIDGENKERVEAMKAIKKILQDADFDMYVSFYDLRSNASGKYDFFSLQYKEIVYEPFEDGFGGDILEDRLEEKLNE
ncbi:MAG: hypothetical protein HDT40_00255 [Lachnospiraceae bacterium]|nr:hypothetical protein [Lachnospiraceae bacterium]